MLLESSTSCGPRGPDGEGMCHFPPALDLCVRLKPQPAFHPHFLLPKPQPGPICRLFFSDVQTQPCGSCVCVPAPRSCLLPPAVPSCIPVSPQPAWPFPSLSRAHPNPSNSTEELLLPSRAPGSALQFLFKTCSLCKAFSSACLCCLAHSQSELSFFSSVLSFLFSGFLLKDVIIRCFRPIQSV